MVGTLLAWYRAWLTAPVPGAAGTVGIYRILFALYYFWRISTWEWHGIAFIPIAEWQPVSFLRWVAATQPPSTWVLQSAQVILVGALAALLIGYHAEIATPTVLVIGLFLDAMTYSFGKVDHASVFLTFFIPLFMTFTPWGMVYSVSGRLAKHPVAPSTASWHYIWPRRGVLLMLSVLYFTAGWLKITEGAWLYDLQLLRGTLEQFGLNAYFRSQPESIAVLTQTITRLPILYIGIQWGFLLLELLFPLALFHPVLRRLFLLMALLFHAMNNIFLNISFILLVMAYMLFVDWQRLLDWLALPRLPQDVSPRVLHGGALAFIVGHMLLWNASIGSPRPIYHALIHNDTLWNLLGIGATFGLVWMGIGAAYRVREMIAYRLQQLGEAVGHHTP